MGTQLWMIKLTLCGSHTYASSTLIAHFLATVSADKQGLMMSAKTGSISGWWRGWKRVLLLCVSISIAKRSMFQICIPVM